jgi:Zn-dependent protease with chaperone function
MATAPERNGGDHPGESGDVVFISEGAPARLHRSPLYVFGLAIVAVAMLVLPLLYLALIAGVGYLTYLHAIHGTWLFGGLHARGMQFRVLAYVTPLVAGAVLVLFMIKPLFARRGRESRGFPLHPEAEPGLYAHIERLCRIVRAPMPREIHVDCRVNASASFRRGLLSFLGRDLRLTIGLPLVAGLSLREFTGVLAHEFGHFSQGLGMRLTYVIRSINEWFARVVYERDAWDEKLAAASHAKGWRTSLVAGLTRACVWLTRRILWILMIIGHGISCFMLRRMEYDADRYEVYVAGTAAFANTARQLRLLSIADEAAHADLGEAWRERRLADDLPALIVSKIPTMPQGLLQAVEKAAGNARTAFFDTHPSDRDRLRAAQRDPLDGIIRSEAPATELFADFAAVCRSVSFVYYQEITNEQLQRANLVPTALLVEKHARARTEHQALERFLGLELCPARALRIPAAEISHVSDPRQVLETLRTARRQVAALQPRAKNAYQQYADAQDARIDAARANALLRAKFSFAAADFHLSAVTADAIQAKRAEAESLQRQALELIRPYEEAVRQRLLAILQLLRVPAVGKRVPHAMELLREAEHLLTALNRLDSALEGMTELMLNLNVVYTIGQGLEQAPDNATFQSSLETQVAALAECVGQHRRELSTAAYPFSHALGPTSIGEYLLKASPDSREPGAVVNAVSTFLENLAALHPRLIGRLAVIALAVEAALQTRREDPTPVNG